MPCAHQAIANLIHRYAECVDKADFAGIRDLFADAAFTGSGGTLHGGDAIARMFEKTVIVHADGTLRTKHVTTNLAIEVDEDAGTATSRAYYTVLQAVPDLPLQPIACGTYHDTFTRHEDGWRFTERRITLDLAGDVTHHLRHPEHLPAGPRPSRNAFFRSLSTSRGARLHWCRNR
ncbi:nuclear transport factor 2 family protein [Actinomadura latina]|uniref:Nuclear transport factor 2 family protein n=1 Tax=Actinomadura latina TaxID=163603 RepID=A0A846YVM1_9ACTN|nr:nuclear transport factor 2 family protein [Actinomadura latina]NKZ04469.1 nuclear transport factor 2 family protein [Actinomadura latina]